MNDAASRKPGRVLSRGCGGIRSASAVVRRCRTGPPAASTMSRPRRVFAGRAAVFLTVFPAVFGGTLPLEARRGTEPMSAAQRFSMPETERDGAWSAKGASLWNTPEAAQVVRVGDIDNFGFGWQAGATPFQGRTLRERPGLWTNPEDLPDGRGLSEDPPGTDRLQAGTGVPAGAEHHAPGEPGYYAVTAEAAEFDFIPAVEAPERILLQLYLAGFDAERAGGRYVAELDGEPAPFLEKALNRVRVADEGGRLLTVAVPAEWHGRIASGRFRLRIDHRPSPETETAEVYAVDFLRLLIDPVTDPGALELKGRILPVRGYGGLEGARARCQGREVTTDPEGRFRLDGLCAGLSPLEADGAGGRAFAIVSLNTLVSNEAVTLRLEAAADAENP